MHFHVSYELCLTVFIQVVRVSLDGSASFRPIGGYIHYVVSALIMSIIPWNDVNNFEVIQNNFHLHVLLNLLLFCKCVQIYLYHHNFWEVQRFKRDF